MFNKGDNVFFLKDNKIHSGTVHKTCAKEVSGEIVTEDSFYKNNGGKAHGFNRGMEAVFFFFHQKRLFRKKHFFKNQAY